MHFQDILAMRRNEQARRGMPLSDPHLGAGSTGTISAPDPQETAFYTQGIGQIPEEPALDLPDDEHDNPQRVQYMEMMALNPESTLQPKFENIAKKYAIIDLMQQPMQPPTGGGY